MGAISQVVFQERAMGLILGLGLLVLMVPGVAYGHRVTVFAWVEGDQVHTESKISGGKVLKNADIDVYDMAGELLLQGKTDPLGCFSFKAPKPETLKIVLRADMGHQAQWTVQKEEFGPAASQAVSASNRSGDLPVTPHHAVSKTDTEVPLPSEVMEKVMDQKLAPILRQLAELREQCQGPTLKDILGGIGYILGLLGVAAYVQSRKK